MKSPTAEAAAVARSEQEEEAAAAAAAAAEARRQKQIKMLLHHILFNVTTLCIPIQAGPSVLAEIYNGDFVAAAKFIGMCSASDAAFQFLMGPTIGAISDQTGRKQFLLAGPAACALLGPLYALAPYSLANVWLQRAIGNGCNGVSGSGATSAALADLCSGMELAKNSAAMGAYAGLGVILGPILGGVILARFGPGAVYLLRAAFSAWHYRWLQRNFDETLEPEQRRPQLPGGATPWQNPLSFVKLFTNGASLAKLTLFNSLNIFTEGKNLNDLNQLWMKANLGMSVGETAAWTVAYGASMFAGGMLTKNYLMPRLGGMGYTRFAFGLSGAGFGTFGTFHSRLAYWLGLLMLLPGINGAAGSYCKGALWTGHAKAAGLGLGEMAAANANLRSLLYIVGPVLYTRVYAHFTARKGGNAGAAYYVAALVGCAAPLLLQAGFTHEDLNPQQPPAAAAPKKGAPAVEAGAAVGDQGGAEKGAAVASNKKDEL